MLLKREIDPKIVPNCSGRGRRGSGCTWRRQGFNSAPILTVFRVQKASNVCHDRTTIAPRSGHDRASIVILELHRSSSARVGSIPRQNACDRRSIARFFHVVSAPSDGDPPIAIANNCGRLMHLKPFDLMTIDRFSGGHVA